MGGQNREGTLWSIETDAALAFATDIEEPGGKAKPLKAAKKEKKELDEEDKAFLEKKKAGS
jgi:hypothetical protein